MNPLLHDLPQFKELQCISTLGPCIKFREDIQYCSAVFLSKAEKKNPHIKQNITMPVPVSSTEDGGSEWLLGEDTTGTTGGRALYTFRKTSPSTA